MEINNKKIKNINPNDEDQNRFTKTAQENAQLENSNKKANTVSVVTSIGLHLIVFTLIKTVHFENVKNDKVIEENYVDLGYQQFDEVPQLIQPEQKIVKEEPIVKEKIDEPVARSQEMQDQSSQVSGTQKEVEKKSQPVAQVKSGQATTFVPYYKIKPKYPAEALEGNIEGFVLLAVDILEDGSVENIKVTGGEQVSYFEIAATRAVAKWKYQIFVDENGKAIKKTNYLVRVDFKIKDEIASR